MDQPRQANRRSSKHNGFAVLMSLYLLLVAFFVMLNSMAQFEESRIAAAMGSVKAEFRNESATAASGREVPSQPGLTPAVESFHSEVRQFFEVSLPIDHVDPVLRGDILSLAVPTDDLFRQNEVAARPRGRSFLDAMATSLKRTRPGLRVEVEMVFGTGTSLPGGGDGGGDGVAAFELRRASGLAHALRRRGVAAAAIRTGLIPGDPGQISFIFRVRDEEQPRITFSDLAAR